MNKNKKNFLILIYKSIISIILYVVFILIFSLRNVGYHNLSRTFVITTSTFTLVGLLMLKVYGNFEIGKRKSKPIIYSTFLAFFWTDLATYIQLMVMNTNPANNNQFQLVDIDLLFYVLIVQLIIIYLSAYFGNWIYFKLFKPLQTIIIYNEDQFACNKIEAHIRRHKLQYNLVGVYKDDNMEWKEQISKANYVVLLDASSGVKDEAIEICFIHRIEFSYYPTIMDVILLSGENTSMDDVPIVTVNLDGLTAGQKLTKRILDLIVSSVGFIISLPLWIVFASAIKLEDGGSIFFKQKRATINGKVFEVYKFRTMKENSDNYSATENDDRITKVGKILRKIRMDELPQIINILNGEMSVVGPRPEMLENVEKYEKEFPEFRYRLKVKAGLTGIAQIDGKYNTTPQDKLIMDLSYIENYSIFLDFKLILRTLVVLFKQDSTEGFDTSDKEKE